MNNLFAFIKKYNAFFLFLIFEISSLVIYIKYNSFQNATFINSANQVTGDLYARRNNLEEYLSLSEKNDSLNKENARLRSQLKSAFYVDTVAKLSIKDTIYKIQYEEIPAKVINNSVNRSANYITLNRGSDQGIEKGMGVISGSGVVGQVMFVSQHFSIVQSVLHKDTHISAMLADNKDIGSFIWGTNNLDPTKGVLTDVSNNARPKIGEAVITTQYSLYPPGILIGRVSNLHPKEAGTSLNMEVELSVNFSRLEYVYVTSNKFAKEQAALEALPKKNE